MYEAIYVHTLAVCGSYGRWYLFHKHAVQQDAAAAAAAAAAINIKQHNLYAKRNIYIFTRIDTFCG